MGDRLAMAGTPGAVLDSAMMNARPVALHPSTAIGAVAVGAVIFALAGHQASALAGAALCPEHMSCARAHQEVVGYRKELVRWKERLAREAKPEGAPDEAAMERTIADLGRIAQCGRCTKRLRSEALQVQSGTEGLLATYYDHWGPKRGQDGRRSFRAAREAARVDPDNLPACTSYGRALVAIDHRVLKARIAGYMEVDLAQEMERTAANLRRLMAKLPAPDRPGQQVLDDLTRILGPAARGAARPARDGGGE
jgi:hypothetical protein